MSCSCNLCVSVSYLVGEVVVIQCMRVLMTMREKNTCGKDRKDGSVRESAFAAGASDRRALAAAGTQR